jgi:hypothetical protein
MLDDLRNSAAAAFDEEGTPPEEQPSSRRPKRSQPFLGMTAPQRFVVVLMLFMMTCLLGSFCLILTEKIVLPFF